MLDEAVRAAIRIYRRSPVKPFKGPLLKMYQLRRRMNRTRSAIVTVDGIAYDLDLNETIDSAIYHERCFEPDTTEVINRLVRPGMVAVDIGANIGAHALRLAKLVGPTGVVVAFEPMSVPFSKLRRNVALNGFQHIVTERMALSDQVKPNQAVALACSWPLSGGDRSRRHPVHHGYTMPDIVDFVTLDEYARRHDLRRLDVLKVDVDGYELKVLRGAADTLRRHTPVVILELGTYTLAEAGDRVDDLVAFVSALGYRIYSERGLRRFPDLNALKASIPERDTINVVLSTLDPHGATGPGR